jgi:flagellar hook assembly protein FlgD
VLAHVVLRIYDLAGQEVYTLVDRTEVAGGHQVRWDGRDAQERAAASGIYLVRLQAETGGVLQWSEGRRNFTATRKMVLIR